LLLIQKAKDIYWKKYMSFAPNFPNMNKKQRTYIGKKYSFVNRTMQLWNQLPSIALGTLSCKPSNFRKRVRKVTNEVKWRCGGNHQK
jgi:hypothetical protein